MTRSLRLTDHETLDERVQQIISQDGNEIELTDDEDKDEFVKRFGEIEFQYIKRPPDNPWIVRPHALNYFKDGVLFRTKGERTSGKTELFLDLLYVAIIANVAGQATEEASWAALLRYLLFFFPYWTVWADVKDFTNYYYSEDLSQRFYIMWILVLLALSVNSHSAVLESTAGAAYTIVPYMLCRLSLAVTHLIYSFYIPEHRPQQRLYFCFLMVTTCLWIPVIFVSTRKKIAIAVVAIVLEHVTICVVYHPRTKKLMKLSTSTALNLEHEVERCATFVVIAIGEFLIKVVLDNPLGVGITDAYGRGVFLLIIAYALFWIYFNGGTNQCATHPCRHSALRAMLWLYSNPFLLGAIVLAADAGGELLTRELVYHPETALEERSEEPSLRALVFFFTGGIFVSLWCIGFLGALEKSRDDPAIFAVPRWLRIAPRFAVGVIILCLAFAEMNLTLMMGMTAMLMTLLFTYECVVSMPKCGYL